VKTETFEVVGIASGDRIRMLTQALRSVAGFNDVTALRTGTITLQYDENLCTSDELATAANAAGFVVEFRVPLAP
jgi:hypothetical protein